MLGLIVYSRTQKNYMLTRYLVMIHYVPKPVTLTSL